MKLSTLSFAGLTLFGVFALSGCGSDNQQSAPSLATTTKDEIAIPNGAEPESLDLHKASDSSSFAIIRQMFVGLVSADEKGATIPALASEWDSTDGKVWTFKIRDAKWSDDTPITAHDFVYSFRRLTDPNTASPYSSYLVDAKVVNAKQISDGKAGVETLGVRAVDDKTLEISLSEPVPYLPDTLIHTAVKPVNQKAIEQHGDKWTAPGNYVVNGAYNLKDWQVNERIVLERNTSYYDDANTTINTVTILAIPSEVTDVTRYKAGEIDLTADSLPSEQFKQLQAELGDQVKIQPKLCTYYYEFNHTKAPFDDVRVRKALSLTLDREIITNNILAQGQTVAYQYTPNAIAGMIDYEPDWRAWDKAT